MKIPIRIAAAAAIVFFLCPQNTSANEVRREVLKNGLVVLIKESHKSPLVAIEAGVKTGSASEQGYLGSGISHFVEHMVFKGTSKWPGAGDIEREIKALGGYTNGFTSHDSTGFQIIVPSEYANGALQVLKEIMTAAVFDPAGLEKERNVILKEIRMNNDDPSRYVSQLLWSNMFKSHNYRFPVIGYEELFKKLKREDLAAYYKTLYIPDNIVIGIVGDINCSEISKKVEELFGGIDRVSPEPYCSNLEPPQITGAEVTDEKKVSLAYLLMGFHSVGARDKGMFGLDVLSIILGGGEDSRLFKGLYRKERLVYSVGSFNYTPKDPGVFGIGAVLQKENIQKAQEQIWRNIEDLKIHPVTDKELEKAKNQVLSSYIFSRQTVQDEVGDIVSSEIITGDYDFSRKYIEGIRAVTKELVMEAAKKYLKKENETTIKLLPPEPAVKKTEEARAKPVAFPKIEKFKLRDNLRVLILEDHTLPVISVTAIGLGGLRTEDFKTNGISNLVSQTLLCGTKKQGEDEISMQIETMGASINSFSASNAFGLSASCLSNNLNPVLDIFFDVLQNPEFSAGKIEREKSTIRSEIKSIGDDIYQTGMRTLKYTLFQRHPYRFPAIGRVSTIEGLTQKEIRDYHNMYYRPGNMVLAISGDIDKGRIKEKLGAALAKFEPGPAVKIEPLKEKKRNRTRLIVRDMEKEQSLILLGYLGTTIGNHDAYVLEVLSSILSGINGRLFAKIREQEGMAYTLDAKSIPGIDRGLVVFYIGTTKENLETIKRELFKEIGLLKNKGVEDKELKSAKTELIGLQRIGLQRAGDIAARAALDELYGSGYDDFLKYEDRVNHVTKECILRAARKYLRDNSYVMVIIKGVAKEGY